MKPNIGTPDQILRLSVGFILVFLAGTGALGLWAWIGAVLIVTAAFRWCPIYRVLGLSTCKTVSRAK